MGILDDVSTADLERRVEVLQYAAVEMEKRSKALLLKAEHFLRELKRREDD